jgi:hypothetical protein
MVFPSPDWMSLKKLSLARNDLIIPGQELFNHSWPGRHYLVTSQLETGKTLTFFYSVEQKQVKGTGQRPD